MAEKLSLPNQQAYYDRAWAAHMVRALRNWHDKFGRSDFDLTGKLITGSGRRIKTTLVTDASYTILLTDHLVDVNRAGAVALTLPLSPTKGDHWDVQDSSGNASVNNITINRPSVAINVNGGASVVLATDYGRLTIYYNGSHYVAA